MPKPTKGKRLGGSSSHEDQIISNLISALIQHEKIETTVTIPRTNRACSKILGSTRGASFNNTAPGPRKPEG